MAPGQAAPAAASQSSAPYVLHVYEDMVQVPTMVLTSAHESYRGLRASNFDVQLDGGPKFHPKEARMEGDDPLSLSLLLDARHGEHQDLVRDAAVAVGHLSPDLLTHRDHLSVFAYDCTVVSSVLDQPVSTATWQAGITAVLKASGLHGSSAKKPHCTQPVHLWDAMAAVTGQVGKFAGRRVLVVVSDGADWGSKATPAAVRDMATSAGLTIFGIQPAPAQRSVLGLGVPSRLALETAMNDSLGLLCGSTGGLLAGATPLDLDEVLGRIVHLVRERYILEFPRPRNGGTGSHEIDVSVANPSAIVRSSGVTVAVQDPLQQRDVHTVPKDTSKDPTF